MRLKILSYNIHKGFDWNNKKYCLDAIKKLIQSSGAEIIFLQEVIGENIQIKNKGLIDNQFEYLADELFPHYSYARNALYDHGHHGNLILSKYPIQSYENINISTNALEKRGMLVCNIIIPTDNEKTTTITACCVHLNLLHISRKAQYEQISTFIMNRKFNINPCIIAGDFNDWNKKSFKSFENELKMTECHKFIHGYVAKTFPSKMPFLSLDRIYIKNFKIISSTVLHPKEEISDHLPIFCELEII